MSNFRTCEHCHESGPRVDGYYNLTLCPECRDTHAMLVRYGLADAPIDRFAHLR